MISVIVGLLFVTIFPLFRINALADWEGSGYFHRSVTVTTAVTFTDW